MDKRNVGMAAGVAVLCVAVVLTASRCTDDRPGRMAPDGDTPEPQSLTREPASQEAAPVDRLFHVDPARLYDLGYETDPALVAAAERAGKSPACFIAIHKAAAGGEDVPAGTCEPAPVTDDAQVLPAPDHPYSALSDAELEGLTTTSPEAAVILARRTEDNAAAAALYERAVILSGKPGPLAEWMTQRRTGGLELTDGVLDVELARVGYEVHLVMEKLGHGVDDVAFYEQHLQAAGIPLAPIRAEADARFARMTAERQALTGHGWQS